MFLFKKIVDVQKVLASARRDDKSIGFVPTMGALHEGHFSLIRNTKTDFTVCSIFVNPTQFDDPADLQLYPKTMDKDLKALLDLNCDLVFVPKGSEIYPDGQKSDQHWKLGELEKVLEGARRPGHFQGVAQVVRRLLDIVQPDILYLGQKDYQQFLVVQQMLDQSGSKIKLEMVPTVREADGLAMSSRNSLLSDKERRIACKLSEDLLNIQKSKGVLAELISKAGASLTEAYGKENLEYLESRDPITFSATDKKPAVVCAAVRLGNVRLIDNVIIS